MTEGDFTSKRKPFIHHCKLHKTLTKDSIEDNEKWYRKLFMKLCFISPNVSNRKNYTKSIKVIEKERLDHWHDHFWIIHPFSDFIYYMEIFMVVIYFLRLVVVPYLIFQRHVHVEYMIFKLVLKLFTCLYVGIQFFTGYYEIDVKQIVLDRKKIVRKYLRTYFTADFLGNIPIFEILYLNGFEENFAKVFKCFVIFNIFSLIKCIEAFQQKRDLHLMTFKLINTFLILGISLTWLTALIYLAVYLENPNEVCNVSSWWWAFHIYSMVFGYGVMTQFPGHFVIVLNVLSLSFGYVIRSVLLVKLILWGQSYIFNKKKKHCLSEAINEFCCYHKIPPDLRSKIMQYYDYKFQNVYYNEANINELLSTSMKHNLETYECNQLFDTDIFKLSPLALKQLIAINIEKDIFLKNDVIHSIGDKYDKVYFIKYGTVIKYNSEGEKIGKIEEGNFFAKKAFLRYFIGLHRNKAVAAENSTIFSLPSKKFDRIMRKFPEDYINILKALETENNNIHSSMSSFSQYSDYIQSRLQKRNE